MKSFKVAAVSDHNFEQCSKAEYASSSFIQFRPGSGQDVDGLVARPRLVTSELTKVHVRPQTQDATENNNKKTFVNFASNIA